MKNCRRCFLKPVRHCSRDMRDIQDYAIRLSITEDHQVTLAVYVNNIIILNKSEDNVRLINSGKNIGLQVNKQNIKYLIMS